MDQTFMKERPIVPLVISMAIPMTISMLVNSLYNIIDSYYVARISEQAMTALSLVYPAQNLLIAVTVGYGIGQVVSLIIYLVVYYRDLANIPIRIAPRKMHQVGATLVKVYSIGIPAALNLALSSLMITVLNGILAVYSASYVLVLGAYYKLQTFIYLTANGIVQGMRPICSYNYGAGEFRRLKAIFRTGLAMVNGVMVIGTLLCILLPNQLIGIFASNADTIQLGREALLIICRGFVLSGVSVTISGVLEGLGKGAESLVISLARYIVVLLPLAYVLSQAIGAAGVWHAFWITEATAAVLSILLFRRIMRKIQAEAQN